MLKGPLMRAFFLGRYDEGGWSEAWAGGQAGSKGLAGRYSGARCAICASAHSRGARGRRNNAAPCQATFLLMIVAGVVLVNAFAAHK